jgi:hypothetical protein
VVVLKTNVNDIAVLEPKRDAPVGPHGNCPFSLALTFELVQRERARAHILRRLRTVKSRENSPNPVNVLRNQFGRFTIFIERFNPRWRKAKIMGVLSPVN